MTLSEPTPAPSAGDAEIIRLLGDREGSGLRLLLARHGGRVKQGLKKRWDKQMTEMEIDEVLATATFQAWRNAHTYDPSKGLVGTWFFVIAHNAARVLVRDRQRWRRDLQEVDVERVCDRAELVPMPPPAFLETLWQCIADLPRLQRCVIEADLQNGDVADAETLAAALCTTKSSVYVSRSAARKALKHALMRRGVAPGDGGQS
jgi:DNA-directed RNA polymerase specialized sigma24 family protein